MPIVQSHLIYVMGIDPGGSTGWAVIGVERDSIFSSDPRASHAVRHYSHGIVRGDYTQQVLRILNIAKTYHDPFYTLALAVESFIPREPGMTGPKLAPLQINYRLQFLADTGRIKAPIFYQSPDFAKGDAPNKRLRKWGLYAPGEEHPKDATRHAIAFIRHAAKDRNLAELAWPAQPDAHRIPQLMPDGRSSRLHRTTS